MQNTDLAPAEVRGSRNALDRPLAGLVALDWEKILFATIMVLAIVSRFWDLGTRALHHDESLHATYSYYLFTGRGYVHDPLLHGTFIYHLTAFVYLLFGASDFTTRVAPAFLSVLTVGLPYLLRRELGRWGALVASTLLLISPSFLYFGRFIREDAHMAFFTLATVVCIFRYLDSRRPLYLYVFAALLALSFATKETTYITVAIFGSFLFLAAGVELLRLLRRAPALSPMGDMLVILGTLSLPQLAGFAILYREFQGRMIDAYPTAEDYRILVVVFVALVLLSAVIGLRWNPRLWLITAAVFYGVFIIFFTTLFSNPPGFLSGSIGGLVYWLAQQEVKRGGQPWFYYLVLMPLYEYLILFFAVPGAFFYLRRPRLFTTFLLYWAAGSLLIYSWAGEKMPWLVLHVTLPILLLGAKFLANLLESTNWRERLRDRGVLVGAAIVGLTIILAVANTPRPISPGLMALQQQYLWLERGLMVALLAGLAFVGLRAADRLGWRSALVTLTVGSLLILGPLTVRTAVQASFVNGDTPVEMLVYTQTSPDVTMVMREIERVAFRTGAGNDLRIAYDSGVSWPFEWYLRDYRNRNFYGTGTPAADAPIVLVSMEDNRDAQVRALLGGRYVGQRYRLRWWFPEDYRSGQEWLRAITPEAKRASLPATPGDIGLLDILRASWQPDARERLWRYFLYREPLNPLGSTDFVLFVRRDLASGAWLPASVAPPPLSMEDPYEKKTQTVAAITTLGTMGSGDGHLREPKNVALGPSGSIYVLDTGNHRVARFASDGSFLANWGGEGTNPGEFKEPWGIAVDAEGNVYVTDTWNHRVQVFDGEGRFLRQWGGFGDARGQPGVSSGLFYGPRGIALDADGNVLVVDTGNKRVQRFTPDGTYLSQHGSQGGGEGLFNEPVGIAVDAEGNVYVADTWNNRIQVFDADLRYLAEWDIPAWMSESVVNKPFLVVDGDGNVYASDPEGHRLFKFSSQGELEVVWGSFGADATSLNLPLGLAVDDGGNVYVADSANHRVVIFPPVE